MLDRTTALHLANRLGFGPAPGDLERIQKLGFEGFLNEQLDPRVNDLPTKLQARLKSLPDFGKNTFDLYRDNYWKMLDDDRMFKGDKGMRGLMKMAMKQVVPQWRLARMARAIASPHRLHEALVDFWFNHFNVYEHKGLDKLWVGAYEEEAIRPRTLGKFSDLLLATAKHPAMLIYLDNAKNTAALTGPRAGKGDKGGINENYAREVMELHTLGVDGGYSQADVTALAHVLTGWTVGVDGHGADYAGRGRQGVRGGFRFVPRWHDRTPQTVLGRRFATGDQSDGEQVLLMLAHHPSTARHVSLKLAQYFVADQPDPTLVNEMAAVFKNTDGDIKQVIRAMFTSKDFRAPANVGKKFKTPYQYVVSVARLVNLDPKYAAPLAEQLKTMGQPIYGCATPDGYACTEGAWLDPDAMMRRLSFAVKFGRGAFTQPYLAHAGYGTMGKPVRLDPADSGAPLNPDEMMQILGSELSGKTRNAVQQAARTDRAGLILGSPDFMRC
jgi:uncharacterized protein (DUF1800 family)